MRVLNFQHLDTWCFWCMKNENREQISLFFFRYAIMSSLTRMFSRISLSCWECRVTVSKNEETRRQKKIMKNCSVCNLNIVAGSRVFKNLSIRNLKKTGKRKWWESESWLMNIFWLIVMISTSWVSVEYFVWETNCLIQLSSELNSLSFLRTKKPLKSSKHDNWILNKSPDSSHCLVVSSCKI